MSTAQRVDTAAVIGKIVAELGRDQPRTSGQLTQALELLPIEINVALDRAQSDGSVLRRVIAGRVVYHLAGWEPIVHRRPFGRPALEESDASDEPSGETDDEAAASAIETAPATVAPTAVKLSGPAELLLSLMRKAHPTPFKSSALAKEFGRTEAGTLYMLGTLERRGLVKRSGQSKATQWHLTELTPPAAIAPAVQATVTDNGASEGEVSLTAHSRLETSPPGPRHGPSLTELASGDALLRANEAAAARDAELRTADADAICIVCGCTDSVACRDGCSWAVVDRAKREGICSCCMALIPAPQLPFGFIDGERESHEHEAATAIRIGEARYALWSDGRLQIDARDTFVEFSAEATKQLVAYLDHIAEIDAGPI